MKKLEINYPCKWSYKIIGSDKELIYDTIPTFLDNIEFELSVSNQSRTGKYTSFDLTVEVKSEEQRNRIFCLLKEISTVKVVI